MLKSIQGDRIMDFSDLIIIKIKELMDSKNINVNQLANATCIYDSTLNMLFSRKNKTLRLEHLLYICNALDITLSDFFADSRFKDIEAKDWHNN